MDRLDELAVLVAVVECGSLVGAARRLGRSPTAVTRGLAALEARVGTRLAERTTRRLVPTEAGRDLAEQGRRLLDTYEGATSAIATAPLRGLLRLTAPLVFGRWHVTPFVTSFLERHQEMAVDLVLHDRNLDLIEERCHLGVRIGHLQDSGLIARKVGTVRRLLVASPTYLVQRGTPHRPEDLGTHETILGTGVTAKGEWRLGRGARARSVRVTPRLRINEVEAALQAVRAGRGIARVLSYQVAEDLAQGRLVRVLSEWEPDPLPVHIVLPSGRAMAPKVRAFLDEGIPYFAALPVLRDPSAA